MTEQTQTKKISLVAKQQLFGPHFRSWRERRGYSLKEAAGNILSPQALSQFELGKTTVSIVTFNRLLISIGVEWIDFMGDYPGEQTASAQKMFWNLRSTQSNNYTWGSMKKQLQEELEDYYEDNPFIKEIFFEWLLLSHSNSPGVLESRNLKPFISHMLKHNLCLNTYEGQLLLLIFPKLPLKEQLAYTETVLANLKKACQSNDYRLAFRAITDVVYMVKYLSALELYLHSQDLINKARATVTPSPVASNLLLLRMVELDMEEIFLWLMQNNLQALKKAENMIEMLDHMINFFPHNNWQLTKQAFIHGFNQFNKTGKLLYED
ncbi:helix-turn-helix domain-containing protein [Streptococcus ovuberis]|uniref:Helix-turn-helix domain-containing protein n=1 Tax=Streptococcus ovuberis TaxID=1936207 RepID=A0A7X6MXJ5_9STRE|nr:helix-turn-helix transcriptional regulator [Streptococcus ovuberis]NKZ20190.1 helix-turn-helix domain-containing protein [Streptococcus ovuberis]